jgi:hypothetical protein
VGRRASLLGVARGIAVVPVLFLKRPPLKGQGKVFLPQDVISLDLSYNINEKLLQGKRIKLRLPLKVRKDNHHPIRL